jgi:Lon protease-like protein
MDEVTDIPMFPLGSVLFPAMPLGLRVFEPRYLQMLQDVMPDGPAEFGVVLIERGQEVSGRSRRSPMSRSPTAIWRCWGRAPGASRS